MTKTNHTHVSENNNDCVAIALDGFELYLVDVSCSRADIYSDKLPREHRFDTKIYPVTKSGIFAFHFATKAYESKCYHHSTEVFCFGLNLKLQANCEQGLGNHNLINIIIQSR